MVVYNKSESDVKGVLLIHNKRLTLLLVFGNYLKTLDSYNCNISFFVTDRFCFGALGGHIAL